MTKVFSARPIPAGRDADNSVSDIGEGAAPGGNQASPTQNTARTRDSNVAPRNTQQLDSNTLISDSQDSRVGSSDGVTSPAQRKAIRHHRQLPRMRGLMGLSVAVAVLCSLPMALAAPKCDYQVLKAGKCVDPDGCAKQDKWLQSGACEKCPEFKTPSKDRRTCIDPTCDDKKADEYVWEKTGECKKCDGLKTADKDHKKCVEPKCDNEYFYWSTVGKCEKCDDYKLQNPNDKGKCMLKKCETNEKITKTDKPLKLTCEKCPLGKIAGGDNKEKCVVEFNENEFKKADTEDKDAKKTLLNKQEFIQYLAGIKYIVGDTIKAEAEFKEVDTNDDKIVTEMEARAEILTNAQFKVGDYKPKDKFLEKEELKVKTEAQNAILKADFDKGWKLVNSRKSIDGKTVTDQGIDLLENNEANQIVLEFQSMDADNNKKLTATELNDKFARWQADHIIEDHGGTDKLVDILEYADHHQYDATGEHHCTKKELLIVENNSKDVNTCSSRGIDCWEDDSATTQKYAAKNDKCKNKHESCSSFTYLKPQPNDKDGKKVDPKPITNKRCILSRYCDKTKADGWNFSGFTLKSDKFDCPDGIKKDDSDEKDKKAKDERQKKKEKFATDNKLEFSKKGHKCTTPGKNLGIFDTPKLCMDAAAKADKCNFFEYAQEWPKKGCFCCNDIKPVENSEWDVYSTCVDKVEKPPNDNGEYSKCFNDKQLKAHNAYRKDHGAKDLKINEDLARAAYAFAKLQKSKVAKQDRKDMPWKDNKGKFCGQNVYELESKKDEKDDGIDEASLKGTDYVSKQWYAMNDNYDFTKHTFKAGKKDTEWQEFTQMVWKSSTEVGFGIFGKFVVAQYCSEGNFPVSPSTYGMNVCNTKAKGGCKECEKGKESNVPNLGYLNCFNKRAVDAHNIYRETHKKTPGLKIDPEIAAAAQKAAEGLDKAGAVSGSPESERKFDGFKMGAGKVCAENTFVAKDDKTAKDTDAATDAWYKGNKMYNYKEGKAKAPTKDNKEPKKDVDMFARVVWKATTKVGFGVKGKYVVAWYCEDQGATGDEAAYKKNIEESCIQANGVNKCFNEQALKANNKKRDDHGTEELTWDEKAAEEIQRQMGSLEKRGILNEVNINNMKVGNGDFKNCGQNVYTQDDEVNLLKTDVTIDKWYAMKDHYNFDKGTFKKDKKKDGQKFTLMMWRASKKVGFGISGKFVVAWYCPKGNNPDTENDYLKNVCEKDKCLKCLKADKKNGDKKWNTCYNEIALKETNLLRKDYKAKDLKTKATSAIGAQKHAEKLLKDGKLSDSDTKDRPDCVETIYEHTVSKKEDLWDLNNKNIAMRNWVENKKNYDFTSGKSTPKVDGDDKKKSDLFTAVVWKASTEVGFGIAGKYVVAWICNKEGNKGDSSEFKKNVGDKCILDDDEKINECYNTLALKAHNDKRIDHGTPKLEWDKEAAKAVQKQMEAASSLDVATIKKFKMEGNFKDCGFNVYENSDTSKIVKENLATDAWYKNEDNYDYSTGEKKKDMDQDKSDQFTNMMWKGSKKVGFGIKGKYVVAWYCPKGNDPRKPKDFKKNVCKKDGCKLCLEDKKGVKYGYNKCYNKDAVKSTNLLRGKHNVKKVELGEDVAKGAQEHAEKLKKDDKISKSDDSKRKKCWENTYKLPDGKDEFDLAQFDKDSVNMALKEWHDQVTLYNFKDGKEQDAKDKAKTDQFTAIVWKANDGKKVGFGIAGKYVVGWYCDEPNKGTASDYKKNVFKDCMEDDAGKALDYNECYNDKAKDAHNLKRKDHGTDALVFEAKIAKEAQKQLDALTDKKLNVDEIKKGEYKLDSDKCSMNVYTQDDAADLLQSDVATNKWYEGESSYSYDNGEPKDAKAETKKKSLQFTNMLWKSSKKVGFGIKGKFVLAYYCTVGAKDNRRLLNQSPINAKSKHFKMNICKKDGCKLCTEDKAGKAYGFNKCFNQLGIDKHNIYRIDHESPKFVKYDEDVAKEAQKRALAVSTSTKDKAATDKTASGLYKDNKCNENIFMLKKTDMTDEDLWDVMNTDMVFKGWHAHEDKYDYKAFKSKADTTADNKLVKEFTQVVWKYDGDDIKTIQVGFGIADVTKQGVWVYAYYCKGGNIDGKYAKNVFENCNKDDYNKCYNDRAVKAHNDKREKHFKDGEDYKMKVDVKAAQQIQEMMDKMIKDKKVMTEKSLYALTLPNDFKDCNANVHEHTDAVEQLEKDEATDGWYANSASYDYTTSRPKLVKDKKDDATTTKSNTYTQLVWKTSKKVGFGIVGKFVVAWYCDKKGNDPDTVEAFTNHVCKVDGCHPNGWERYTLQGDAKDNGFSMSDADKKDKEIKNVDCGYDKWCPFKGGDKKTKPRHCGTHINTDAKTITEKCVDYDKCETVDGKVKIACLWRQCDPYTYRSKFADQYMCKMDKCTIKDGKFVKKGDIKDENVWDKNTWRGTKAGDQGRCGQCKSYEKSSAEVDVYKYIAEDFKKDGVKYIAKTKAQFKADFGVTLTKDYEKKSYGKGTLSPCEMCPIYQKRNAEGKCEIHKCKDDEINVRDGVKQGDCIKTACEKIEDAKTYEDTNRGLTGSGYRGFQTKTESGKVCLAWDTKDAKITAKTHPNAGLEQNYCRNPDSSKQIWCYIETKTLVNNKIVKGIDKAYCKPRTDKYDYCYNKAQIKAHNKYRNDHKSKDLVFRIESAIAAQKYLDGLKKDPDTEPPASKASDRPDALKDCGENIFALETKDKKKLGPTKDTNIATDTWYKTREFYDHEEDAPKASASKEDKENVKTFMQVVWKGSKNVGFGIRDNWVVAWYCPTGNTVKDKDNEKNVCPVGGCIDDCVDPVPLKDGYSSCFNRRSERDLNIYKKLAKVAKVKYDPEVAKRAQKYTNEAWSGASLTADGDECDYILYYASSTAAKTLGKDDQVTKQWYAEKKDYDFKLHKKKEKSPKGSTDKFEKMMWAKSVKVGFGFKKKPDGNNNNSHVAIGLFCPPLRVAKDYKCNICPEGGCTDSSCPKDKPKPKPKPPAPKPKPKPKPKAPVAQDINECISPDGNKVTISWNTQQKRIEFNAEVKINQYFTLGLGDDLDFDNQIIFESKPDKKSDLYDATGTGKGKEPKIDFIQSIAGSKIDTTDSKMRKFKTFRKLDTGDKVDKLLKLNTLYDFAWGENLNSATALSVRTNTGKCQMKLKVEKCPAGKEKDERDPSRIIDCSTKDRCYDYTNDAHRDNKCRVSERCAKWSTGNGKEDDGCIRKEYCQKYGDDVKSNVLFDCGDGKCTQKKINDTGDRVRQKDCSSMKQCKKFNHSNCPDGEKCAVFSTTVSSYNSCVLKQYCGTNGDYKRQGVDFDCQDDCADYTYWSFKDQRCVDDAPCGQYSKLKRNGKCESCGSQKATKDGKDCEKAQTKCPDWTRRQSNGNCEHDKCNSNEKKQTIDGTCKWCDVGWVVDSSDRKCVKKEVKCKYYQRKDNSGNCIDCKVGETVSSDGTRCLAKPAPKPQPVQCKDYTHSTAGGQSCIAETCTQYQKLLRSGYCDNCPPGQKAPISQATYCEQTIVCPDYKRNNGSGICIADNCSKFQRLDKQGRCVPCNAGDESSPDGRSCVPKAPECPEYTRLQASGSGTNRCRADPCNFRQKLLFDGTCDYCGLYSRVSTDGKTCAKDVCVLTRQIYSKDGTCITCPQYTAPRADNYVCIKSHQYIKNQGQGPIRVGNNNGILSILGNAVTVASASVLAAAMVLLSSL